MCIKKYLIIVLLVCLFPAVLVFPENIVKGETTGFESYYLQTEINTETLTAFARLQDNQIDACGIESRYFTAGTVRLKGLLRAVRNPHGYSVRSQIYRENTRIQLDTVPESGGVIGVALRPFPDLFSVFLFLDSKDTLQAGTKFEYTLAPFLTQELLCVFAYPYTKYDDSWYLESFPYQPGGLVMTAARTRVKQRGFLFVFDGFCSAGETVPAGFAWSSVLDMNLDAARISLQGTGQTDSFTNSDGSRNETAFSGQLAVTSKLTDFLIVSVTYGKTCFRNIPIESVFYSGKEHFEASARTEIPFDRMFSLLLQAQYSRIVNNRPLIIFADKQSIEMQAETNIFQMLSVSAGLQAVSDGSGTTFKYTSGLYLKIDLFYFSARISVLLLPDETLISPAVSVAWKDKTWKIYCTLETDRPVSTTDIPGIQTVSEGMELFKITLGAGFSW